ncbi:MAG: cyclase family protein [Saprospiraceae bacterium]
MKHQFIDLSHTIEDGLISYKGLPAPIICDYISREASKQLYDGDTTFQIDKIEMVGNTGTYIDCPLHRYAHGKDFTEIGLAALADLEGIKIIVPYQKQLAVTLEEVSKYDVNGKAVLIQTNWSAHWNTELYYENHPFLTEAAAIYLRDNGAKLVGIDSHNMDDTRTRMRPAHTVLLGANILVVEHLCNLDAIPAEGFLFSAVPPKVKGMGTFPVRAMAKVSL